MQVMVELSLYPLVNEYIPPIKDFNKNMKITILSDNILSFGRSHFLHL